MSVSLLLPQRQSSDSLLRITIFYYKKKMETKKMNCIGVYHPSDPHDVCIYTYIYIYIYNIRQPVASNSIFLLSLCHVRSFLLYSLFL